MKKLLQKTLALALAIMMIAALTVIAAGAEETTASAAADSTTGVDESLFADDDLRNVARDEGVSYAYARLAGDPGSEESDVPGFANPTLNDDNCTKLIDGETINGHETMKSAGPAGTCRTIRFKFDLGAEKVVSKIALLDMYNSYKRDYNGRPAGNRGYDLDTIMVFAGEDLLAMLPVGVDLAEEAYVDEEGNPSLDFFKVFITLKEEVTTRYLWIDVQIAQPR